MQQKGVRDIVAIVGTAYAHYEELLNQDGIEVLCGLSAQEMADYFAKAENVVCFQNPENIWFLAQKFAEESCSAVKNKICREHSAGLCFVAPEHKENENQ